jgi:type II secretory pathway component GspD/PulD (secretin)
MKRKNFTCKYAVKITAIILLELLLGSNGFACFNNDSFQDQKNVKKESSHQKTDNVKKTNSQQEIVDTISVDIKNVALKDIFSFISDNYGTEFIVTGQLPPIFVTVKVSDVPWQEVLGAVLQSHNISYQLIGKKCYINADNVLDTSNLSTFLPSKNHAKGFGDPDFQGNSITINIKDVELDSFLRFLSNNYNFNYALNQLLKDQKITVKVQDQPWNQILTNLLQEHHLGYNRIGTVVYIFPLKK